MEYEFRGCLRCESGQKQLWEIGINPVKQLCGKIVEHRIAAGGLYLGKKGARFLDG